jgi:hypothetical protein
MRIIKIKQVKSSLSYIRRVSEKYNLKKILEFTGWSEDELKKEIYEYEQDMRLARGW